MFAVKFIHKAYATRHGRVSAKQIASEVTLHAHLGHHNNIIQFFSTGEDQTWRWVAMELAEGGDLFDKIESDEGVGEDIAHFYFTQLISAVGHMHSKGVGHRDLKPENILLSASGDLKVADFGMATLFYHEGKKKLNTTMCGSPPYIAPEVITCSGNTAKKQGRGYYGNVADIWSCGVVLFVLLLGNTPWDQPDERSFEYTEYTRTNGRPDDELWHRLPPATLSLLRGMIRVDPKTRFSLEEIRRHPWFTRKNRYLSPEGRLADPIALATQMLESMRVDFSGDPTALATQMLESMTVDASGESITPTGPPADGMDIDSQDWKSEFASTQPDHPVNDIMFDWERPARIAVNGAYSASQPVGHGSGGRASVWDDRFFDDPSFSQFSATPSVPVSRTQFARQFRDIVPSHSLARFFSFWSFALLIPLISAALHRLGVPTPNLSPSALEGRGGENAWIKVKTTDTRNCPLSGDIAIERIGGAEEDLLEVNFIKVKGDPVEWRRFFKKVVVLCKDGVYKPDRPN